MWPLWKKEGGDVRRNTAPLWVCRQPLWMFMCVQRREHRCGNFAHPFSPPFWDRASELLAGLLVEVLAVDDPHLLEESRLAALARAEQQDLHEPLHRKPRSDWLVRFH
uniref:Uncharacterized protein n=1 Tax=Scophthalmus maximus TaxID=52904 RepID=A0A8D3D2W3_SCOMX